MSFKVCIIMFILAYSQQGKSTYCHRVFPLKQAYLAPQAPNIKVDIGRLFEAKIINRSKIFPNLLKEEKRAVKVGMKAIALAVSEVVHQEYKLKIKVELIDSYTDANGVELPNILADYSWHGEQPVIRVATKRINDSFASNFPLEFYLALILAHEATHHAQSLRGDQLTHSLLDFSYSDNPHELEAWQVSVKVLKKLFPKLQALFLISNYIINIRVLTEEESVFAIPKHESMHHLF